MKCKHKWIDADDGTRDKICTKCLKRAKQTVLYFDTQPILQPLTPNLSMPVLRETITINTGPSHLGKVTVYKDDLLSEINKQLGFKRNYIT
ncbi:MAG: hypothetical protein ACOX0F_13925 [Syntrophomonadaceae bacterium]|jgi:hypothetical protein